MIYVKDGQDLKELYALENRHARLYRHKNLTYGTTVGSGEK